MSKGKTARRGGGRRRRATVDEVIDAFTPTLPPHRWDPIAPFVRDAVRACNPVELRRAKALMSSAARYVDWCRVDRGVALTHAQIFDAQLIAAYTATTPPNLASATVGNRCSHLTSMAAILNPDSLGPRFAAHPRAAGLAPLTAAEVDTAWTWAAAQPDAQTRRDATLLLAGCLGAGLTAREVCELRGKDIHVDDSGVLLHVAGPRPRAVPVLAELEHLFIDAAARSLPAAYAFLPERDSVATNTASNFLASCTPAGIKNLTQRARVTWIIGRLAAGTRIEAVMQGMGISDFSAIARYLAYVPALSEVDYRTQMRAA